MSTRFAIVLRNEFVPVGKRCGDEEFPMRDIYSKVLPMGSVDVPGVLLGYPKVMSLSDGGGRVESTTTTLLQLTFTCLERSSDAGPP